MTLYQLLTEGEQKLREAKDAEAQLDARRLLLEAFQTDTVHFLMNRMLQLSKEQTVEQAVSDYWTMIERRCQREPIQYILGSQEFMGLTFRVNHHVLIPRQDTETLVEQVLKEHTQSERRAKRLLDLCTGSGCIAISLMVKGGFRYVTATDISEDALSVARENAHCLLESGCQLKLCRGDLFQALEPGGKFDILVSNPPYIPTSVIRELQPEVRNHEPVTALDGSPDGKVFYRRIAGEAEQWLNPGAAVYLEIGYDQGEAVCGLLEEHGFNNIKVIKDLPGLDRVVRADYG